MTFVTICDSCGRPLDNPGGLAFSPPGLLRPGVEVRKYHICINCFYEHHVVFGPEHWTVEHSFECRLTGHIAKCPYPARIAVIADQMNLPGSHGRWRIAGTDELDQPILQRADS